MIIVALDGPVVDMDAGISLGAASKFGLAAPPAIGPAHAPYRAWPADLIGPVTGYARDYRRGMEPGLATAPETPHAGRVLNVLHAWGFLAGYSVSRPLTAWGTIGEWLERNRCPSARLIDEAPLHAAILTDAAGVITSDPGEALTAAESGVRVVLLQHRHPTRLRHPRVQGVTTWGTAAACVLSWPELREDWEARRELVDDAA